MDRRIVVMVVLCACGGSRSAPQPRPDLDNMMMYEPFQMRAETKRADQAVILGTDEKGGSTVLRIPTAPATAIVETDETAVQIKLTTAPNDDGEVHVGIIESRVGDGGSQWRSGVWVAAIVASHTLGKDLSDFTFAASANGFIDGPSASALVAGGFLATMTGAQIDPTVTMTGVVNPDGTIGPVAGVARKLRAAIAKGKKRIGFPAGMRRVREDGVDIDLVELAQKSGATAVEVANVFDVYRLLTGKTLPAPLPVAASEMALEPETSTAIAAAAKTWQTRYDERLAALRAVEASTPRPALAAIVMRAKHHAERAAAFDASGAQPAALARRAQAWRDATAAIDSHAVFAKVQGGDVGAARAAFDLDRLDNLNALPKVAGLQPTTIGGHLRMMGAFQPALSGAGLASMARWRVDETTTHLATLADKPARDLATPAIADPLLALLVPAELVIARSEVESTVAVQRMEFEDVKSLAYMCSIPNVQSLAKSYRSAASAGMTYLDALLVEPVAKTDKIALAEARMRIASTEPDYLVAHVLAQLEDAASHIKDALGGRPIAWHLLLLAGAVRAYFDSAQLVMKHYSLASFTEAERVALLASMLAHADTAARSSARAALVATGSIPVQAKIAYQVATAERAGDLAAKLDALASYWSSTAYSHAAVMLARN